MSPRESNPLLPTTTVVLSNDARAAASPAIKTPGKQQPHALLGIACVAASAVCFSVMSTFVKLDTRSMTSMEAVFWRSSIAGLLNYCVLTASGQSVRLEREDRRVMLYRVIAGFASISFQFYAISQMVLADASVIIFTSPVFTFFLGALVLHERIDAVSLLCAIISFVGLLCVVRPQFLFGANHVTAATDPPLFAVFVGLLGAVGQAFVYVLVRKLKHIGVSVILHYFMLFSTAMSLLYILAFEQRFVIPDTPALWASVIGSGVFTFFGQMLLTKGFQLEKAGVASVMRYLDVVCVFIWDALLLGERINHWSVVGAVIICACAAVIALRKHHSSK